MKINIKFFLVGAFFVFILLTILKLLDNYQLTNQQKILRNVYIDHIDFSNKSKTELISYFNKENKQLESVIINVVFDKEIIATFSGKKLGLRLDSETAWQRAYLIGRSQNKSSQYWQLLTSYLKLVRYDFNTEVIINHDKIKEFIDLSNEKYSYPAKNALFKFENNKVLSFRKEENGQQIKVDEFNNDLDKLITKIKTDKSTRKSINKIYLNKQVIDSEIKLSEINSYGIEEEIAYGQSDYTHSSTERIHNLTLAASKFNGILIAPNSILSFSDTVGDISLLTGYKPAYIIKDGKTVLGDGGGVCQVSTTLFRAALNAGLPIIERHAHAYRVNYYENDAQPGFDATIFAPTVDLKIKNDTKNYILIQTNIDKDNNYLLFHLYGKKDDRKIEVSKATVWDVVAPPAPKYQDDPTLKRGITRQIEFPSWGTKASFTYKVYKGNKLVIDDKFFSSYRPWQAVFLVGTAD